ncbi:MAG TPA: YraN family protein [Usitatibacteraceae bacterium]|nr:YraN family protein [Usitatibacteraceae bacterium]
MTPFGRPIGGSRSAQADGHAARGQRAEQLAGDFLKCRGLKIIERNYRCRMGEIDLVARERNTLVFVEVRLRTARAGHDFGGAAASITPAKQARIVAAAQHYLAGRRELPACRFDVLLFDALDPGSVQWIQGAFTA